MPPKLSPKCCECQATESLLWRGTVEQKCQKCYEKKESEETLETIDEKPKETKDKDIEEQSDNKTPATLRKSESNVNLRKSTRSTRFKSKSAASNASATNSNASNNTASGNKSQNKRNRRTLFKKTPSFKLPPLQASTRYTESVFYKGTYMQVGDIVSLVDKEDNVYYAQIRGLLVDAYCEKSAFLTWLIPTQESPEPRESFDPATYLIGYDEDFSRKLSYLEFVMHAPSNYYHDRTQPFPLPDELDTDKIRGAYIWTRLPWLERQRT